MQEIQADIQILLPEKCGTGGGNILLSYHHPAKERSVNEIMRLYLAGQGINNELNCFTEAGYDRLLSYELNKSLIDLTLARENPESDMYILNNLKEELMDLFLSGAEKFGKEEQMRDLDLYLVGPEKSNIMEVATDELKSNVLFSYAEKKAVDKYRPDIFRNHGKLFIDSGAFSAWTQGKVIDVDEYIDWINERAEYIDLYGQVDVIPGDRNSGRIATREEVKEAAEKTWENYLYMRPKMKNPEGLLYTFHVGEPIEFLIQALKWTDSNGNPIPYIALGGMVGKPAEVRDRFLSQCFQIIKNSDNPQVKVHAFGMTDRNLLRKYPITSADSTSWIMTAATGSIMTDVGTIAVSNQQINSPSHYSHLPKNAIDEFNKNIAEFGFTLDELAESRDKRIMHNARFMKKRFSELEYKPAPERKKLF